MLAQAITFIAEVWDACYDERLSLPSHRELFSATYAAVYREPCGRIGVLIIRSSDRKIGLAVDSPTALSQALTGVLPYGIGNDSARRLRRA